VSQPTRSTHLTPAPILAAGEDRAAAIVTTDARDSAPPPARATIHERPHRDGTSSVLTPSAVAGP
jgi:hypothetical protein